MPDSDFDLLVEVIRQSTGEFGTPAPFALGRLLAPWQSDPRKGNSQRFRAAARRKDGAFACPKRCAAAPLRGFFGGVMGDSAAWSMARIGGVGASLSDFPFGGFHVGRNGRP